MYLSFFSEFNAHCNKQFFMTLYLVTCSSENVPYNFESAKGLFFNIVCVFVDGMKNCKVYESLIFLRVFTTGGIRVCDCWRVINVEILRIFIMCSMVDIPFYFP